MFLIVCAGATETMEMTMIGEPLKTVLNEMLHDAEVTGRRVRQELKRVERLGGHEEWNHVLQDRIAEHRRAAPSRKRLRSELNS